MPSAAAKARKSKSKHQDKNRQRKHQNLDDITVEDVEQREAAAAVAKLGTAEEQAIENARVAAELLVANESKNAATDIEKAREAQALINADARNVTGSLGTGALTTSVHINNMSVTYYGQVLIEDTDLVLNNDHRYGIIGPNGCGKSTLLAALAERELPIPESIDIFYLDQEVAPSDKTPLEVVMEVDSERKILEAQADQLQENDPESPFLMQLYERLDDLDAEKAEVTAARILTGLGFNKEMQQKCTKDFSGGWRMRVSLARALFVKPYLLLLDEPTNHLDLEACVWLEEELSQFPNILMIVSHSQDFMNGVCSNIINIKDRKLEYYTGNYDQFIKTKSEVEEMQMKAYNWEQEQIANMKQYIARFGHGSAKLAKQAQSKEKTLAKMIEKGLTPKVTGEKSVTFEFKNTDRLAPPVIQVQDISFRYNDDAPWIYKGVEFGLDQDTRLALVGPNGAGKSTLVNIILGQLEPTDGMIKRHSHVKMGHFHQHLAEKLDMNLSSIEFMMKEFKHLKEVDQVRKIIGRYGISGKQQAMPIRSLSDGQKCRVALAWVAHQTPHMLMLDEPTNHLDLESIDALANAIKNYNGGLVLVSHDFRLISQVAKEIWICEKQSVTPWTGSIQDYKQILKNNVLGKDGKKKDMAAASADHYNKVEVPAAIKKVKAPAKKMSVLSISSNKKTESPKSSPAANGSSVPKKFVPPGKRGDAKQAGVEGEDWW